MFGNTIGSAFRKSFRGKGRASRAEYWLFTLFCFVVFCTTSVTGVALELEWLTITGSAVFYLLVFPYVAVSIRRLHDSGRSGHWAWLLLTCAFFVVPILCSEPSQPGPNRYGGPAVTEP